MVVRHRQPKNPASHAESWSSSATAKVFGGEVERWRGGELGFLARWKEALCTTVIQCEEKPRGEQIRRVSRGLGESPRRCEGLTLEFGFHHTVDRHTVFGNTLRGERLTSQGLKFKRTFSSLDFSGTLACVTTLKVWKASERNVHVRFLEEVAAPALEITIFFES